MISNGLWRIILPLSIWVSLIVAKEYYNESLNLKPLPRNKLLSSFQFQIETPIILTYNDESENSQTLTSINHYTYFPRALGPVVESTNTRELHLRFTQGWWDSESWGRLASNGLKSGGTGVELWAVIEAPNINRAKENWFKLSKSLSGFFCASLNFIDDSITTFPRHLAKWNNGHYISNPNNKLYLLRASLPSEPICTENLTPFLKLLPTRGKAGVSSLLDGHKVFDSLWHGMSIDIVTQCDSSNCNLSMSQSVNAVIDIMKSIRKKKEGGIPKPTPGGELLCDKSKVFNIWQCFPLDDPTDVAWDLETIFGRTIKGPAFIDDSKSTAINIEVDPKFWNITIIKTTNDLEESYLISDDYKDLITYYLNEPFNYDFKFSSNDSTHIVPVEQQPLYVSRSLTGYSQDQGGFRVLFSNPSETETIDFIYFESLPWYMRLYLNTLSIKINNETGSYTADVDETNYIRDRYYKPAIDRKRPSHLEFSISIPPKHSMVLTYQFDKSLLLYAEYPPDANHGFAIEPAVITILDGNQNDVYELRTTSLLLSLPTPDFSMPYNVIILTCTIMSLAFGSIFNLLTKKVITEEELEKLSADGKAKKLVLKIKEKINRFKSLSGPSSTASK